MYNKTGSYAGVRVGMNIAVLQVVPYIKVFSILFTMTP